jgi:hypothetical protein|nr:Uncharacterized conserved protein (COG1906) [uncultured Mediterranean phage uvMED]BAR31301.1 Uncharacterized conserved protein (COG1906) [uncultured Mediterranean phage uvMED]
MMLVETLKSIATNELYMGYIFGIMILGGFIREHSALEDVYSLAKKYVKDHRILVIITSLLGGILPIPGRVALSAPLLDAIAPPDKERRSAFGVIDYLSVHHYYWWSPLEKTVVLPMAVMGVSYGTFLGYTIIPLIITLTYTWWYIFTKVPARSVVPNLEHVRDFNWRRALTGWAPLIATVILLLNTGKAGAPFFFPWFLGMSIYYSIVYKDWKWGRWLDGKFAIIATVVLALGGVVGLVKGPVMEYLKAATPEMLIPASLVAMVAAYIMGSSGKYAGMTSVLVSIFGPQYLVWFLCTEYSGYLISPAHKCLMIGQQYFGTPIRKYYVVLSRLCAILIAYAAITTFIL